MSLFSLRVERAADRPPDRATEGMTEGAPGTLCPPLAHGEHLNDYLTDDIVDVNQDLETR